MSSRARQLGEAARQSEAQSQANRNYEMYKVQMIQASLFQLTGNIREAARTAMNEFNGVVGRDSKAAINYFAEVALGLKMVKEHYPSVYLTAVIDPGAQCVIVECVKTDRSGRRDEPTSRYPLDVEDSWVRIRDGERLITESEFADLLIERFV